MVVVDNIQLCWDYFKQGMKAKEISEVTGIKYNTVHSNIYKARYKETLEEYEKHNQEHPEQPQVKLPDLTKYRVTKAEKDMSLGNQCFLFCKVQDLSLAERVYMDEIGQDKLAKLDYKQIQEQKKQIYPWLK